MADASFTLNPNDSPTRLDHVIARVVQGYTHRNPERLEMISVRTVWVDGELRKKVSSPSSALVNDIRDLLRCTGGLSV